MIKSAVYNNKSRATNNKGRTKAPSKRHMSDDTVRNNVAMSEMSDDINNINNSISSKIPSNIHQIWFQGKNEIPRKYLEFSKTWVHQQSHTYNFWDSTSIDALFSSKQIDPLWRSVYHGFPTMIQKIDFAKYVILYMFGGVYIDMDVFAVRDLSFMSDLLSKKDFIVFQHNTPCITITMNKMMGLQGTKLINNAVIFSSRRNEKMRIIINTCCAAQLHWRKNLFSLQLRCLVTTGPIVFTNCIRQFEDWESYVMPAEMFEPYTTLEMTKLSDYFNNEQIEVDYDKVIKFLISHKDMSRVVGIHVLDLNWFKNGKNNWKFKAYRSIQKIKKSIIAAYR